MKVSSYENPPLKIAPKKITPQKINPKKIVPSKSFPPPPLINKKLITKIATTVMRNCKLLPYGPYVVIENKAW